MTSSRLSLGELVYKYETREVRKSPYRKYEVNDLGRRLVKECHDTRTNGVSIERLIVFMHDYNDYLCSIDKNRELDYFIIDDFSTFSEKMIRLAGVLSVTELGWIRRLLVKIGLLDVISDSYIWYNENKYSHPKSDEKKPRPKLFGMDRGVGA